MSQAEAKIIELGIHQLRMRIEEQRQQFKNIEARFPSAHLECLDELLDRFEARLSSESILSDEVQPEPSSPEPFSGSANKH